MKTRLLVILVIISFGCGERHNRQINLISEYEQVIQGVKTDLNLKVLEIDRVANEPVDSFYFTTESYRKTAKIIEEKGLENEIFPIYLVTYRIHNPILNADQEQTKYYAFDPKFTIIVADWPKK